MVIYCAQCEVYCFLNNTGPCGKIFNETLSEIDHQRTDNDKRETKIKIDNQQPLQIKSRKKK